MARHSASSMKAARSSYCWLSAPLIRRMKCGKAFLAQRFTLRRVACGKNLRYFLPCCIATFAPRRGGAGSHRARAMQSKPCLGRNRPIYFASSPFASPSQALRRDASGASRISPRSSGSSHLRALWRSLRCASRPASLPSIARSLRWRGCILLHLCAACSSALGSPPKLPEGLARRPSGIRALIAGRLAALRLAAEDLRILLVLAGSAHPERVWLAPSPA